MRAMEKVIHWCRVIWFDAKGGWFFLKPKAHIDIGVPNPIYWHISSYSSHYAFRFRQQCIGKIFSCASMKKWEILGCFVSVLGNERNLTWRENGRFLTMSCKKMVKYDLKIKKLKNELDCIRNLIELKTERKTRKNQKCARMYIGILLVQMYQKVYSTHVGNSVCWKYLK